MNEDPAAEAPEGSPPGEAAKKRAKVTYVYWTICVAIALLPGVVCWRLVDHLEFLYPGVVAYAALGLAAGVAAGVAFFLVKPPAGTARVVTARSVLLSLGQVVLLGGLGGGINAWLCYVKWPVSAADFDLSVVPAGAGHGAILALVAVGAAMLFARRRLWLRFAPHAAVGWVSGFLSFLVLHIALNLTDPKVFKWSEILEPTVHLLTWPFFYWGLVGLLYYFALCVCRGLRLRDLALHMILASVSGILGSLWWWTEFGPWYFSLIHGAIWGGLVGFGMWSAVRRERPPGDLEARAVR
jgi:hypothetical protein